MTTSFMQAAGSVPVIRIPEIGLDLLVRVPPSVTDAALTMIETTNAPGFGPPRHRHREAEIFRVMEGQYLFDVDGRRFVANAGDVVAVPGGAAHAFVNVTDAPARQLVIIMPGLDAAAFFTGLAETMKGGRPDPARLGAFGERWGMEFLGPPLTRADAA